jgi:hypothetical protein
LSRYFTRHGKPVAELQHHSARCPSTIIGLHHSLFKIQGDILSPLGVLWKAIVMILLNAIALILIDSDCRALELKSRPTIIAL